VRQVISDQGDVSRARLLRSGRVFAHREMLTNATHEKTTRARGHVELLALSNSDLMEVLRDFPDIYVNVYNHARDKYNFNIDQLFAVRPTWVD